MSASFSCSLEGKVYRCSLQHRQEHQGTHPFLHTWLLVPHPFLVTSYLLVGFNLSSCALKLGASISGDLASLGGYPE